MQENLLNEGFIKNKNSNLDKRLREFCQKSVAKLEVSGDVDFMVSKKVKDHGN